MKNLVVKTALITVCSILLFISLLFGVFALCFPKALGNMFYQMGAYNPSMKYYERQCKRTEDFEDLYLLMVRADTYKDYDRIAKYGKIMVEKDGFAEFCANKSSQGEITAEEFIEGKYVIALYISSKNLSTALDAAEGCVDNSYTEYNPFYMLYAEPNLGIKKTAYHTVIARIQKIQSSLSAKEKAFANSDIQALYSLAS